MSLEGVIIIHSHYRGHTGCGWGVPWTASWYEHAPMSRQPIEGCQHCQVSPTQPLHRTVPPTHWCTACPSVIWQPLHRTVPPTHWCTACSSAIWQPLHRTVPPTHWCTACPSVIWHSHFTGQCLLHTDVQPVHLSYDSHFTGQCLLHTDVQPAHLPYDTATSQDSASYTLMYSLPICHMTQPLHRTVPPTHWYTACPSVIWHSHFTGQCLLHTDVQPVHLSYDSHFTGQCLLHTDVQPAHLSYDTATSQDSASYTLMYSLSICHMTQPLHRTVPPTHWCTACPSVIWHSHFTGQCLLHTDVQPVHLSYDTATSQDSASYTLMYSLSICHMTQPLHRTVPPTHWCTACPSVIWHSHFTGQCLLHTDVQPVHLSYDTATSQDSASYTLMYSLSICHMTATSQDSASYTLMYSLSICHMTATSQDSASYTLMYSLPICHMTQPLHRTVPPTHWCTACPSVIWHSHFTGQCLLHTDVQPAHLPYDTATSQDSASYTLMYSLSICHMTQPLHRTVPPTHWCTACPSVIWHSHFTGQCLLHTDVQPVHLSYDTATSQDSASYTLMYSLSICHMTQPLHRTVPPTHWCTACPSVIWHSHFTGQCLLHTDIQPAHLSYDTATSQDSASYTLMYSLPICHMTQPLHRTVPPTHWCTACPSVIWQPLHRTVPPTHWCTACPSVIWQPLHRTVPPTHWCTACPSVIWHSHFTGQCLLHTDVQPVHLSYDTATSQDSASYTLMYSLPICHMTQPLHRTVPPTHWCTACPSVIWHSHFTGQCLLHTDVQPVHLSYDTATSQDSASYTLMYSLPICHMTATSQDSASYTLMYSLPPTPSVHLSYDSHFTGQCLLHTDVQPAHLSYDSHFTGQCLLHTDVQPAHLPYDNVLW